MTNLEKIKQMSAEEFTEWFQTQIDKHFKYEKVYCKATDPDFYKTPNWDCLKHSCYNCKECIIDYLNRDAKTED